MNSPFTSVLHTGYVPPDAEIQQIQTWLIEPVREMTRLDEEIVRLVAKRDALKETIDAHQALTSPVRRLPKDIMQVIFISCLPTKHNALLSADHAPLLLCRVCRSWRDLAISLPVLWSTLHIPFGLSHELRDGVVAEMPARLVPGLRDAVTRWLERSGSRPLEISVKSFPDVQAASAQFLEHLMTWSPRWRSIELTGNSSLVEFLAVPRTPDQFPILERIMLHSIHPQNIAMLNLIQVPTLRDVSLKFEVNRPVQLPLPWAQLTSLDLDCAMPWHEAVAGLSVSVAIEILQRCPRLANCTLHVLHFTGDSLDPKPPATLNFLQSFTLFQNQNSTHLLDHLVMPNIRAFKLCRHESARGVDESLSLNSLAQNPASLQNLTLFLDSLTNKCLVEIFHTFSSITTLHIAYYSNDVRDRNVPVTVFNDSTLGILTQNSNLFPRLESLRLDEMASLSDTALLTFIEARMASKNPLKCVHVGFWRAMQRDIIPSLRTFTDAGLEVSLTYIVPKSFVRFIPTVGAGPSLLRY
ncbi:hypothetical protein B0H11DRAFT_2050770 [Mycena galericulata]|nr:hypothetical protein B0H11DRAFT_2050770 [Mycena galericulata]